MRYLSQALNNQFWLLHALKPLRGAAWVIAVCHQQRSFLQARGVYLFKRPVTSASKRTPLCLFAVKLRNQICKFSLYSLS